MTVPSPDIRVYVAGLKGAEEEFEAYLEGRVEAEEETIELRDELDDHSDRQDDALDRIERALDVMTSRASLAAIRIEARTRALELRRQQLRRVNIRRANLRRQRGGGGGLRNFAMGR